MKIITTLALFSGITIIAAILLGGCTNSSEEDSGLFPTGLTIVALSQNDEVMDAIAVEESVSGSIIFRVPPGESQIKVFALGDRVFESYPSEFHFTGRPDDEEWMGLGFVRAEIENGVLTTIDSNGIATLSLSDETKEEILVDLTEGAQSPYAEIDLNP
ncbi:hypothetical protein [Puniceicoccus vermicola]|uniref:Uncharacterized protein n=1 Tax=Puniceicoccus vermicola TaxID=388746 RepID=A0A7X1B076_9BACT|nr:hypothetical protein [Puniceicoccus vermicola]MBC2603152.1 hypothetical protein [Puniceicoccus vermicola]